MKLFEKFSNSKQKTLLNKPQRNYRILIDKFQESYINYMPNGVSSITLLNKFNQYCEVLLQIESNAQNEVIDLGLKYCQAKKDKDYSFLLRYELLKPRKVGTYEDRDVQITKTKFEPDSVHILFLDDSTNDPVKRSKHVHLSEVENIKNIWDPLPFETIDDIKLTELLFPQIICFESAKFDPISDKEPEKTDEAYLEWWELMEAKHRFAQEFVVGGSSLEQENEDEIKSTEPVDWLNILGRMDELTKEGYSAKAASEVVEKEINSVRKAGTIRNYYKGY